MKFIFLLCLLLLTGCGGGSGGESSGSSNGNKPAFVLSKPAIEMKGVKSLYNFGQPGFGKVTITTQETTLVAAMPVGQQKPDWLRYRLTPQTNGVFQLDVEGENTIEALKSGLYRTTIRIGTVNKDGSFANFIDLPVSFDLFDFAEIQADPEQKLNGRSGSKSPSSVNYKLRTTSDNWQLTTDTSWLTIGKITTESGLSDFKVQATAQNLPQGKHTGNIIFKSADGRTTSTQVVEFSVEKQRWWLASYAVGMSQLGKNAALETVVSIIAHDPKQLQSLQTSTDSVWLQSEILDNQLHLKANPAGLPNGIHYAKVKVSDSKANIDSKTVWVGLFISSSEAAVAHLDFKVPSGKLNIYKYLADPLRPHIYVQTIDPTSQLRAYHLFTGELLWQIELGEFVLHEISLDGQQLVLKRPLHTACELTNLLLNSAPAADWARSAQKLPEYYCRAKTKQVDGIVLSHSEGYLAFSDQAKVKGYAQSYSRLDENDYRSVIPTRFKQVVPSSSSDLTIAISDLGGFEWSSRVTLLNTMVLPENQQIRYSELAHLDNIVVNESFYASVTNRLWTGQAFIDLQDGKMSLTSFSQYCPKCWIHENMAVERRDGLVALLGHRYSDEVNDTAKRLMFFDKKGRLQSNSETNVDWIYGWSFGYKGIQLSADQQWLLIGNGDGIDIRRF